MNLVDSTNFLDRASDKIGKFFENHPTAYKVVMVFNHFFRAAMMVGFMFIPGLPPLAAIGICFIGSLFYRLTVEKNCAYKFALPSFWGSLFVMLAIPAIISMINGSAFLSVSSALQATASYLPVVCYASYVLLSVNYEVNQNLKPKCGCHQ